MSGLARGSYHREQQQDGGQRARLAFWHSSRQLRAISHTAQTLIDRETRGQTTNGRPANLARMYPGDGTLKSGDQKCAMTSTWIERVQF
eukprot:scaffold45918_cov59-Phaeocystis_antarctica.AAC.1